MAKTASDSFLLSNSWQKSPFFAVLMYALYNQPRLFQVQAKISIVQPVFPEYLFVSYDYGFDDVCIKKYLDIVFIKRGVLLKAKNDFVAPLLLFKKGHCNWDFV